MKSPPDHAFDYLVERLLDRSCTPFLGAGISSGVTMNGIEWGGQTGKQLVKKALFPTVHRRLVRLGYQNRSNPVICKKCECLFRRIIHSIPHSSHANAPHCPLCDLREISEKTELAKACEAFVWEYGELGQDTWEELVNRLEIDRFAELDPAPAHRFLAWLVREGLIDEIITTNYDCNVEKALQATWLPNSRQGKTTVDVITRLDEYTELADQRATYTPGADTPHRLKLYKINGCAARLRRGEIPAENILLTEGQLQNWRSRHWAEDLFRVRFRSTCLFFAGFGNEEPQIRHTVQQVLEEYSHVHSTRRPNKPIFDYPNAPIVALYDRPSFPQRQMAHGFAQWMGHPGAEGDKLLLGPESFSRHFPQYPTEKLGADQLFKHIYVEVFQRLMVQALKFAAARENAAFTGIVPGSAHLLRHLAGECSRDTDTSWSLAYLRQTDDKDPRPNLIKLLNRLISRITSKQHYTAINDHKSLTAELIALFWSLEHNNAIGEVQVLEHGCHLCIEISHPAPADNGTGKARSTVDQVRRLFISNHATSHRDKQPEASPPRSPPALELCLGASGINARPELFRLNFANPDDEHRIPISVVRLAWRHLFPPDMPVNAIREELPARLQDAIAHPQKYLRRAEASLHRRPYLKELKRDR